MNWNITDRQQAKLDKLENKLGFRQAQNDLRAQYTPPSIFQQNPYMPQMNNPYMQQQPANPMQGMMEMMQTMMPMMMMMKMMGIEGGNDMFSGMLGQMGGTSSTSGASDGSWKEMKLTKDEKDDIPDGTTVTKFKGAKDQIKTITKTDDGSTIVITDKDGTIISTEEKDDKGVSISKKTEKDGHFKVNDNDRKAGTAGDAKFNTSEIEYNEKGKASKITLSGGDNAKIASQVYVKVEGKNYYRLAKANETKAEKEAADKKAIDDKNVVLRFDLTGDKLTQRAPAS